MLRLLQHPVALVLLCFSLVGTPVTYRGGASDPHPHMFLQFLIDARQGSFVHHHPGRAAAAPNVGHGAHQEAMGAPAPTQLAGEADRFGPTLSAFVVGDVSQLASLVPQQAMPEAEMVERTYPPFDCPPSGIAVRPLVPPPR